MSLQGALRLRGTAEANSRRDSSLSLRTRIATPSARNDSKKGLAMTRRRESYGDAGEKTI
jgi:hypothetical protein